MSVSVLPAPSALPSSRIETRPLVPAASLSSAVGQPFDDWRSVLFKEGESSTLSHRQQKLTSNYLGRTGVVVVPDVLTKDKAAGYVARAHDWLEHFDIGYNRDDPSTWKLENLPHNNKGGLYGTTGICHSQLVWDIRQEKGVIDAFARIWGTDELLVSFGAFSLPYLDLAPRFGRLNLVCSRSLADGMNIGVPLNLDDEANKGLDAPWAHTDQVRLAYSPCACSSLTCLARPPQSPLRDQLATIQGIVNLAENGPLDGGLTVFRGSQQHFRELFETFDHLKPKGGWSNMDWYAHPPEMLDWLKARGCHWEKICAPPGALILWDSVRPSVPLSLPSPQPRPLTQLQSYSVSSTTEPSRSARRPGSLLVRLLPSATLRPPPSSPSLPFRSLQTSATNLPRSRRTRSTRLESTTSRTSRGRVTIPSSSARG